MASLLSPYPVAVIGVGNMGGAMAANLLGRGWPVRVCDLVPQRMQALAAQGAVAQAQPVDAARGCVVSILAVVDAGQCDEVLFGTRGLCANVQPGHTVMLCPTIAPGDTERLAARLASCGVAVLDAPMSGGPDRARSGTMSLMVAGDEATWTRHKPLLEALASRLFRISTRVGDGARTKLVNNLLAGINLAGAAEVMALARRMGLDASQTLDVIEQSSGQSWIGSDRMRRALAGDDAPRAHMTLLEKDTRLAVQAVDGLGFTGSLGPVAASVFARASAAGLAGLDDGALLRWMEERGTGG